MSVTIAHQVISELTRAGITQFVLCPGSRSAPFAFVLAEAEQRGEITLWVETDERVAAFRCLGLGLAGTPAVVITTSGSAVANLHPAVTEAFHGGVPMIALTADRPARLRGTGANQTTHQDGMLGPTLQAQLDTDGTDRSEIASIVAAATHGPVHINVQFDNPLYPIDEGYLQPLPRGHWTPPVRTGIPERLAPAKTIILAGASHPGDENLPMPAGVPIVAEPSSVAHHQEKIVPAPLAALAVLGHEIERVIVTGHPTLSRPLTELMTRTDIEILVLDNHPYPTNLAGHRVLDVMPEIPADEVWMDRWMQAGQAALNAGRACVSGHGDGHDLARVLEDRQEPLFIGASNIIRDFFTLTHQSGPRYANRGLAGIDGTISTAKGLATHLGGLTVVLGDLTFIHDLGGLIGTRGQDDPPLDIIVLDDSGGGIFGTLEYGKPDYSSIFNRVFRTAKDIDIATVVEGLGWEPRLVENVDDIDPRPSGRVWILQTTGDTRACRARAEELNQAMIDAASNTDLSQG